LKEKQNDFLSPNHFNSQKLTINFKNLSNISYAQVDKNEGYFLDLQIKSYNELNIIAECLYKLYKPIKFYCDINVDEYNEMVHLSHLLIINLKCIVKGKQIRHFV